MERCTTVPSEPKTPADGSREGGGAGRAGGGLDLPASRRPHASTFTTSTPENHRNERRDAAAARSGPTDRPAGWTHEGTEDKGRRRDCDGVCGDGVCGDGMCVCV